MQDIYSFCLSACFGMLKEIGLHMGMQEGIQLVYIWFLKKGAWDFKNTVHISHFAVFCPKHKGKWSESKN